MSRRRQEEHAPENAMTDAGEIERFYDACSPLMRALLDELAILPDQPRPFRDIEDALGWPRRRIASVLGGAFHLRAARFEGRRPYRFHDERASASGRWELTPEGESRLMELANRLKSENRNVYLEIQGHTDAQGSPSYNTKLGEERAEAARRFLAKQGVALNRIATISYGEEAPVAPNTSREGRAQNRRVVVMVLA